MLPQIWRGWLKSYLKQVCKPCHCALIEAVKPFKLHPMSISYIYEVFEHVLRLCIDIWLHTHIFTTTDAFPDWESWLKSYLMQVCKPCHYALIKALEPFKLHPMSMSYIYEVFDCLLGLWMGIWLHTHTISTTDASPDLGKLADILPDASVQPCH
jgi:hypothetical protein